MISRIRWYHMLPAGGLLLVLAAAMPRRVIDLWGQPHTPQDDLLSNRIECPRRWGTVPLYGVKVLPPTPGGEGQGTLFTDTNGVIEWHPQGDTIGSAREITNIPEFHDCQRFVSLNGQEFDSLFAIFASFKLDSITHALYDSVTWISAVPSVATVTSAGVIHGVASAGTTHITAVSKVNPTRRDSVEVHIGPQTLNTVFVSGTAQPIYIKQNDSIQAISQVARMTTQSLAAATIYNYGPEYTPLKIKPNFSCLYVYFDSLSQLRAKIVPYNNLSRIEEACLSGVNPNTTPGDTLSISILRSAPTDVPPVARWDLDPSSGKYYVGIACWSGWCEIGKAKPTNDSTSYLAGVPPKAGDRIVRVKGWYDEQNLAWRPDTTKPAVPSGVIGTLIPVNNLASLHNRPAFRRFVTVAYVALDTSNADPLVVPYFKKKLNMLPVSVLSGKGSNAHWDPRRLNRMELCFGGEIDCSVKWTTEPKSVRCAKDSLGALVRRWYVKITPAGQPNSAKYRCATRRDHLGTRTQIPGTARWRWILDDETVWTECTQGCCQTEVGGS